MEDIKDGGKQARMEAFWNALREVAKSHGMELSCVLSYKPEGVFPQFRVTETAPVEVVPQAE